MLAAIVTVTGALTVDLRTVRRWVGLTRAKPTGITKRIHKVSFVGVAEN